MNLSGKSREEIQRALAGKTRAELIDIIFSLSTVEQHFRPAEIARRSGMTKRTVLSDIRAGRFGDEYYKRSANQITVSAAGVNAWRKSFRVVVEPSQNPPKHNE
jgi:DNA-binding CsgD family transcriptional regulator